MIDESRSLRPPLPRDHEALIGVFEDAPSIPGGLDVKCPICGEQSVAAWSGLGFQSERGFRTEIHSGKVARSPIGDLRLEWMRCGNDDCQEALVRVTESDVIDSEDGPVFGTRSWLARPRGGSTARRADPRVPEPFRTDYQEASAILDLSPRMSAVMARRILADLLEKYAGLTQFNLETRADAFIADPNRPSGVKENLHHFREAANFGAHTQTDDQAAVIDVEREDAEWLLDILDRLFDHFIVGPERDQGMREKWAKRVKNAGRKPLADDQDASS